MRVQRHQHNSGDPKEPCGPHDIISLGHRGRIEQTWRVQRYQYRTGNSNRTYWAWTFMDASSSHEIPVGPLDESKDIDTILVEVSMKGSNGAQTLRTLQDSIGDLWSSFVLCCDNYQVSKFLLCTLVNMYLLPSNYVLFVFKLRSFKLCGM